MSKKQPAADSPAGRLYRAYNADHSTNDPTGCLDGLSAIRELRADLEREEDQLALGARMRGATWEQIAQALGVTRQRAHQRWGRISDFAGYDDGITPADRVNRRLSDFDPT